MNYKPLKFLHMIQNSCKAKCQIFFLAFSFLAGLYIGSVRACKAKKKKRLKRSGEMLEYVYLVTFQIWEEQRNQNKSCWQMSSASIRFSLVFFVLLNGEV